MYSFGNNYKTQKHGIERKCEAYMKIFAYEMRNGHEWKGRYG